MTNAPIPPISPDAEPGSRAPRRWAPGGTRPHQVDAVSMLDRLTDRDRRLLHLLAEHQVLTTEQITPLVGFPTLDRTQRRLLTLFRAHVLDRFRRTGLDGTRTSWRYALGPVGGALLAAMRGTEPPRPGAMRTRLLRLAAHPALDHLLGINTLFANLVGYATAHPGHHLQLWLPERRATDACGALARPDGLGVWRTVNHRVVFCLEYDTGTENLARVAAKLDGYTDLALAGGPALTVNAPDAAGMYPSIAESPAPTTNRAAPIGFRVLFHLHSADREANLRGLLDIRAPDIAHPPHGTAPLAIATSNASRTRHRGPAADIWWPLRSASGRQALAALTLPSTRRHYDHY
jgi:Replication-relaxation